MKQKTVLKIETAVRLGMAAVCTLCGLMGIVGIAMGNLLHLWTATSGLLMAFLILKRW